jgi:hypothetical protein
MMSMPLRSIPRRSSDLQNARLLALYVTILWQAPGCGPLGDGVSPDLDSTPVASSGIEDTETTTMKLTSTAFQHEGAIPAKYTGTGPDVSPPLAWSDAPQRTKSFALICDDPDAPSRKNPRPQGPWVHWVIYNIPPSVTQLPEGVPRKSQLTEPAGAKQGKNDFPDIGYRGPMPPPGSGPHRYFFKVYALDTLLDLDASKATKKSLLDALKDHILAQGELMGTFERK